MNNKERGEKIRQQILRDVKYHPRDIVKHISKIFSISPQAVNSHIKRLEQDETLSSTGSGKGKRYFLGDVREHHELFSLTPEFAEDRVWRDHYAYIFESLPENVVEICQYGFTEMVNNIIDHSGGTFAMIGVFRKKDEIEITIIDDGEGIFRRIKRLCKLADERQAY